MCARANLGEDLADEAIVISFSKEGAVLVLKPKKDQQIEEEIAQEDDAGPCMSEAPSDDVTQERSEVSVRPT